MAVYAANSTFTPRLVVAIAHGIASAAQHLHARALMHGDLYAHNILLSGQQALLGDFGAASFTSQHSPEQTQALQRVEVWAFGYLLEELLARCSNSNDPLCARLPALREACLNDVPARRPRFEVIAGMLGTLASTENAA